VSQRCVIRNNALGVSSIIQFLNIDRNDPVDIKHIPAIEAKLKTFRINVTGDHVHTSSKDCIRVINLKLLNGHYTLDTKTTKLKVRGIAFKEKLPLMYKNGKENTFVLTYTEQDGETRMTKEEFTKVRANPVSSPFILVPCDSNASFKDEYNNFVADANTLKDETNGLINLFKTGTNVKTALNLFNHFQKSITAEPIGQTEAEWLSASTFAALIFADKYEGPAYKYDVCSHYPSTMSHRLMYFPVKAGSFKKIKDEDVKERSPYGIYRCVVQDDPTTYKQFRYNKKNFYTHIDLQVAFELKLKVTMIQDDQPNALVYERSCLVTGSQLFGQYFEYMFKLKDKKINRAKSILNVLWGALCQKDMLSQVIDENAEAFEILADRTISQITPLNDNQIKVDYYRNESMYETNYARIAPFLISRGRQRIGKIMAPYLDSVVRCHTDSMYTTKLVDVELGTKMGDLKYDGFCSKVKVHNNIRVEGEFIL
jgi:hypothetical protein